MDRSPTESAAFADMLVALLRGPLQATHAQFFASHPPGRQIQWRDAPEAPSSADRSRPGWLFRLEQATSPGPALFVATTQTCAASDPRVQGAALLSRIAWRMHAADEARPMADNLAESIHTLRNGLNSAVMNAALLVARKDEVPAGLHPVLARIDSTASLNAQELHRLAALLESMR